MAVSLEMQTKAIAASLQAEQDRQAQQLRSAVTAAEQPLQAQIMYMMEQVHCARQQAANSRKKSFKLQSLFMLTICAKEKERMVQFARNFMSCVSCIAQMLQIKQQKLS